MKNLDQIDPLPEFKGTSVWFTLWEDVLGIPASRRHIKEHNDKVDRSVGDDWRPTDNPLIEVNGKGQMRTKGYQPPEPPETDIPIPCVQMEPETRLLEWATYSKEVTVAAGETFTLPLSPWRDFGPDKDGWIPHKPGDPMPCAKHQMIRWRSRSGLECPEGAAWPASEGVAWADFGDALVAWKPAT
jgi:hypothetical protein